MEASSDDSRLGGTMLSMWDAVAVGLYVVLVISAGIMSLFRPNRNTVSGYFLAGRFMTWLPVGASLFASNIGSEHFIGLSGSGAAAGIAVGAFELNALLLLQLLGWVFLPVFIASKVTTLPQYMSKRFGGRRIRTALAGLSLLLYIFTKISVNMFSGAVFLQQALRWQNIYVCIVVLLILTALCTAVGGLAAVIYTDTLQFFVMIGGSLVLSVIALSEVGGLGALHTAYLQAIPTPLVANTSCGLPRADSWVMLRSADQSVSDLPWPGFLLGQTPASVWYWCADQMMVQRAMASKSLSHAQGATVFAGIFKLLPLFLLIIPGMVSRVLYTDEVACVDPDACFAFCGSRVSCTNSAYPKLVLELLPSGMRGVMLAVMLSALISDLTSIFNSAATLFTVDLWTYFRPLAKAREQLICARMFIMGLMMVSVAWVPVIDSIQGGELYIYIQSVAAYLSPPIAAVYCQALFNPMITESGAFWGLITGFAVGGVRMALDFTYGEPHCYEEDTRPAIIKLHYMYFATVLFWLTVLVSFLVSLATPPVQQWRLVRSTFWSRHSSDPREDEAPLKVNCLMLPQEGDPDHEEELMAVPTVKTTSELVMNGECIKDVTKSKDDRLRKDDSRSKYESQSLDELHAKYTPQAKDECSSRCKGLFHKLTKTNSLKLVRVMSKNNSEERAQEEHERLLSTLHQEPWEKRLLNCLLVFMCLLCVGLYTLFSINPFTAQQVAELQEERLLQMGLGNFTYLLHT